MDLPDAVVRYADRAEAVIDLYVPSVPAHDTVVFVHGGFWKAAYDRRHARPLARALAEEGHLVALPEYRRVGDVRDGGGWPVTGDDVRTAVRRLPELLPGSGIDTPTRTIAAGHSAGGHLALWLANEDVHLDRVVGLAPVSDLVEAERLGLGGGAVRALMGGGPGEVDYRPADPLTRLSDRPDARVLVQHGTDDDTVPIELSRGLEHAHPWIDVREQSGVGHYDVLDPASSAFADLVAALAE